MVELGHVQKSPPGFQEQRLAQMLYTQSYARALIEIFREWNREWELYYQDRSRPTPLSADALATEIDSIFTITKQTGE